jgi:hypothetical protein
MAVVSRYSHHNLRLEEQEEKVEKEKGSERGRRPGAEGGRPCLLCDRGKWWWLL